jgi:GMP synthase (glutamine-hydrolysing)
MPHSVLALRHLAFEDLGLLGPLLEERGHTTRYLEAGIDAIDDDVLLEPDLVVVLGGPIGANDTDRYPFLTAEIAAIGARLRADRPTLGICLGAQLMARALGARVAPSGQTEIGYAPVSLTADGLRTPLRHLAGVPVLHWHNDRFEIPDKAARLAETPSCDNQGFALGAKILGLQFHLETPPADLERWLIGHAEALAAARIDPRALRHQAARSGTALTPAARAAATEWLTEIGH